MRNYALLREGKPTKVGGLNGGRAGHLVNSKGIIEADRSRSPEVGGY